MGLRFALAGVARSILAREVAGNGQSEVAQVEGHAAARTLSRGGIQ
jgi:hypothetical protein